MEEKIVKIEKKRIYRDRKFSMKRFTEGVDMVTEWLGKTYGINSNIKK